MGSFGTEAVNRSDQPFTEIKDMGQGILNRPSPAIPIDLIGFPVSRTEIGEMLSANGNQMFWGAKPVTENGLPHCGHCRMGPPDISNSCQQFFFFDFFDQPGNTYSPLLDNGKTYKSPDKLEDCGAEQATSKTLFTCFHYDSISPGGQWGAKIPHVGSGRGKFYPENSTRLDPRPKGLFFGIIDSSAGWVKWKKLNWFTQANSIRIYFSPSTPIRLLPAANQLLPAVFDVCDLFVY